jgi:hypothetical protein
MEKINPDTLRKLKMQIKMAELIALDLSDIENNFVSTLDLLDVLATWGIMLCAEDTVEISEDTTISSMAYMLAIQERGNTDGKY